MIGSESVIDWRLFFVVLFAEACFGFGYNKYVLHHHKEIDGSTAYQVVGGVLAVLAGAAIAIGHLTLPGWMALAVVLSYFAAAGFFMVIGNQSADAARRRERDAQRDKSLERQADRIVGLSDGENDDKT